MRLLVCLAVVAVPTLAHAAAPVQVYLNRDGATLTGGADDPARGRSWIASGADNGEVEIPAFTGGDRRWRAIVECVRGHFAPFAVDIVDVRPSRGDYTMIMVGGEPGLLGMGRGVGGVAPADGVVLRRAVGFAFSATMDDAVEGTCETIAHETGHTLGLDHVMACNDLMSYGDCGPSSFVDRTSACGESEARACDGGAETQNSYRRLAKLVGLRAVEPADEAEAEPEPEPEAEAEPEPEPEPADEPFDDETFDDETFDDEVAAPEDDDAAPEDATTGAGDSACGNHAPATDDDAPVIDDEPAVELAAPTIELERSRLRGDRWIAVRVALPSIGEAADLELVWTTPDATYTWSCRDLPEDEPVACRPDEGGATFALRVGTGPRTVSAVAIDRAGGRHVGASYRIELR